MKKIAILGGMSAASTMTYYKELIRLTQARVGGLHSPNLLIRSVDFAPVALMQSQGQWDQLALLLNQEAKALQAAGADALLLATNTMHKVADEMMQGLSIPLLHIADATASAIQAAGLKRPALMATAFTMEQAFYTNRLQTFGLRPVIPNEQDRKTIHHIIYNELCQHQIVPESRIQYEQIAQRLVDNEADCLILGCTEVGMLLNQENVTVPVFDTSLIHCEKAIDWALS